MLRDSFGEEGLIQLRGCLGPFVIPRFEVQQVNEVEWRRQMLSEKEVAGQAAQRRGSNRSKHERTMHQECVD